MWIFIQLVIRSIIQLVVTLGIMSFAEHYVLPLINKAIEKLMVIFGLPEEEAQDIMANELLIEAEKIGVGAIALRSQLPTKVAERLGFTSKGWNKRILTSRSQKVVATKTQAGIIVPGTVAIIEEAAANNILTEAVQKIKGAANFIKTLLPYFNATFLAFLVTAQFIDYGNWQSGAYQKTFQKILETITFGLLKPDEDWRETKTTSPQVFEKVYNTYKNFGAVQIRDPFKQQTVPFTRDNLIDLVDMIGAELLIRTKRASTKDVLTATQIYIDFKEQPTISIPTPQPTAAQQPPPIKVYSGIINSGKIGEVTPFIERTKDMIDDMEQLTLAAYNNIADYLKTIFGKIIYEIKIVPYIIDKEGKKVYGGAQKIVYKYTKNGDPLYRTIINKWAVVDLYIFNKKGTRVALDRIVLGPVNATQFIPQPEKIVELEKDIKNNLTTTKTEDIKMVVANQPVEVVSSQVITPAPPPPTEPANFQAIVAAPPKNNPDKVYLQIILDGKAYELGPYNSEQEAQIFINQNHDKYTRAGIQTIMGTVKGSRGYPAPPPPPQPTTQPPPPQIPEMKSNNPNKCKAATISEYYDVNRVKYPLLEERRKFWEMWGLGPANLYVGTAEQNTRWLQELKKRDGCL